MWYKGWHERMCDVGWVANGSHAAGSRWPVETILPVWRE